MKYILKSLFKRKIFSILTIIQFTLISTMILHFITTYRMLTYNISKTKQLLNVPSIMIVNNDKMYTESQSTIEKNKLLNFYKYIKNNKNIYGYGTYFGSDGVIEEQKNNNLDFKNNKLISFLKSKDKNKNSKDEIPLGDIITGNVAEINFAQIPQHYIDYGFNKLAKISVIKGKPFEKKDFDKHCSNKIPILVGYEYKNLLKIGDKIKVGNLLPYSSKQFTIFKVIGVLQKNINLPQGGGYGKVVSTLKNMNYGIIFPISDDFYTDNMNAHFGIGLNLMYQVKNKANMFKINKEINKKIKNLKLNFKTMKLTDDIKNFNNDMKDIYTEYLIKFLLIGFLVIGGLISEMTRLISMSKREFGIRIATGATKFTILKLVFGEILFMILISNVIAIPIFMDQMYVNNGLMRIDGLCIFELFIIGFVLSILCALIPIIKILKLEPKELIGGTE